MEPMVCKEMEPMLQVSVLSDSYSIFSAICFSFLIMTWFGMMEAKVQIYQYLYFAFCYFCLWIYSFFLCVATFGEQGDEGDAETGVQLPEADCLQGASTKGVMLQV